jgi:NADPH:quinone reductase
MNKLERRPGKATTMKAILLEEIGPPEALRYVDVPRPVPGPKQALVKADTIGVSMPEVLVRRGEYAWMPPLPAIIGIEMSGVVEEVGGEVTSLAVGQPVFVSARELPFRGGCYAEYIAADADALYPLPEAVNLEGAAALANYQVAWHLLYTATRGMRYEWILATGAAGGIGTAILQLAHGSGKKVIGIASSDEKADFLRSLGADGAINGQGENVSARVREITGGRGVDLILDCVGGPDFAGHIERLAPFGLLVSYSRLAGTLPGDVVTAMLRRTGDSLGLQVFSMHLLDKNRDARREATGELIAVLSAGKIAPAITTRLPLSEAAQGHRLIEKREVRGKIVLKP